MLKAKTRCALCRGWEECTFKYIKIRGQVERSRPKVVEVERSRSHRSSSNFKVYKRDTGNIFDEEFDFDFEGTHCRDCGVLYGNTHHVECDNERCPKCRGQLLGCGHLIGVKFHKGLEDRKGVKSDVPINPAVAEKFRHRQGEMKLRYGSWLKSSISDYLEYEDTYKSKTNPTQYRIMLMVLKNILDRMTDKKDIEEMREIALSNEQVYSLFWMLLAHVHANVEPKQAMKYLKIIDENWRPRE
jgi:hypothetical protein